MNIINHLKQFDPDRFLLSFFVKEKRNQKLLIALDILNLEIASIRDVIDTPHMGFIRLQWWRDEIKKNYSGQKTAGHPVLEILSQVECNKNVIFDDINQLITARESDFEEYDDFNIFDYARNIHTPLLKMKASVLKESQSTSFLAESYAVVGLLRAIPFYKARSQVLIPAIQPHAVQKICDDVKILLAQDKTTHPYFKAHRVLTKLYLKQLEQSGYQPEKLSPLPFKELRVWFGTRFN